MTEKSGFSWKNRRRWVAVVLGFHILMFLLMLLPAVEAAKVAALAPALALSFGSTIGCYIFGAAWENSSLARGGR